MQRTAFDIAGFLWAWSPLFAGFALPARTGWDLELHPWLLNLDADELVRRIESHLAPRA